MVHLALQSTCSPSSKGKEGHFKERRAEARRNYVDWNPWGARECLKKKKKRGNLSKNISNQAKDLALSQDNIKPLAALSKNCDRVKSCFLRVPQSTQHRQSNRRCAETFLVGNTQTGNQDLKGCWFPLLSPTQNKKAKKDFQKPSFWIKCD